MSIKDDLKLRLSEEINFNGDGYNIMCGIIDDFFESKLHSHNKAMSAISFRAEKSISKVKNGMASSTIHDIRDILAAVAETAS